MSLRVRAEVSRARARARKALRPRDARIGLGLPAVRFGLGLALGLGLGCAAAACAPDPVHAPDPLPVVAWPTLLGSVRRDGYAREMPPDSPRVVWSIGAGRGLLAPPLVAEPMLFTGTSNRMVMAFSSENGHPYWERHIDGAVGTAVVAGAGKVFAASEERDGTVYALELAHGRARWRRKVGFAAAAPLLVGDTLFVALEDGRVLALDAAEGDERWSARLPAAAATTPVPYRDLLLVAARNDSVYALARASGRVMARAPIGGRAAAPPALSGDTLYLPVESGGIVALGLPAMARLFQAGGSAPVLAPPALGADGSVYFLDGSAEVWKLPPGSATATRLAALGGAARGALTLTARGLLVGRLDGLLTLVRFDGSTAWATRLDGSIAAPAAVVGGAAYVPLEGGRIVKIR